MIRRPPRSTLSSSSAASDVYKRQNVYDVRTGVDSLKGEGITRAVLWPGAGVGGHCLTKDTYHLERGVKIGNGHLDYPEGADSIYVLARKVNDFMPEHMYNLTV